jgi:hypothetical protein
MRAQQVGFTVVGAILLLMLVLGSATVWLYLTNPVTVANAINEGEVTPFIRDLAELLLNALQGLLKYL